MEKSKKIYGIYTNSLLSRKVSLSNVELGKNIKQNLETRLRHQLEGRCNVEGYIKQGSIRIVSYSNGIVNDELVDFQVVFECSVCYPVENMIMNCDVKTITKAGIHCEVVDDREDVPINVFIARDHHYNNTYFQEIKESQKVQVRVIGVRFELNDPYICVIAELIKERVVYKDNQKGGDDSEAMNNDVRLPNFEEQ
jgi:DNA-directed RNA polymerase subunit E'/Rpb7